LFTTGVVDAVLIARELKLPIDLLHTFPADLQRVYEFRRTGKLKEALEVVTSTHDILVNATGSTSNPSKSLLRLKTALQFESFDKKSSSVHNVISMKKAFAEVDEFQVDGLMLLCAHQLIRKDLQGATEAATAAVEACEDTTTCSSSPGVPVHCFSPAYGLKGKYIYIYIICIIYLLYIYIIII